MQKGANGMRRFAQWINQSFGDRLLSNVASLALLQALNYVFPLIVLTYLVRTLGLTTFGELNFALAVNQYFVLLVSYGFALSGPDAIARTGGDNTQISRIWTSIVATKGALSLVGLLALLGMIVAIPVFRSSWPLFVAGYSAVISEVLTPAWLLQGVERMSMLTTCTIVARLISLPATFLLVRGPADAWVAAAIQGCTGILTGVIGLVLLGRVVRVKWGVPGVTMIRQQLVDGWHVFLSIASVSLYTSTTSVLLGSLSGPAALGAFAAADKIRQAAQSVTSPISTAAYPRICSLFHTERDRAFRLVRLLLAFQGGFCLTLSLILFVFARPIVELVFGSSFDSTVQSLEWLSGLPFLVGVSNVFGIQTMLPLGMKRTFSRILLVSGLLNVVLLMVLARPLGAVGASMSTLLTEIVVTVAMGAVLLRKNVPVIPRLQSLFT